MRPYTAVELVALQGLAELHSTNVPSECTTVLVLIQMIRERDEVIATLQSTLDEFEARIRDAVRKLSATTEAT